MKSTYVLILAVLAGCASGPQPMGKDTYMMADTGAWSWSSGSALKANLYKEATSFCEKQGKEIVPLDEASNNSCMSVNCPFAHAEIKFRCVSK